MKMDEETRALRNQIALSHSRVHYLGEKVSASEAIIFDSGVAFLSRGRALGVDLSGTLLKVRLGEKVKMKKAIGDNPLSVGAQVYENSSGEQEYLTVTVQVLEVAFEAEVYTRVPLFLEQSRHASAREWWLELTYALVGKTLMTSPLRLCWSVYTLEGNNERTAV